MGVFKQPEIAEVSKLSEIAEVCQTVGHNGGSKPPVILFSRGS